MPSTTDLAGLDRLIRRFQQLENPDATPLMNTWEQIIVDDNRNGVLAGQDKDGNPMIPVTYRPVVDRFTKSNKPYAHQKNNAAARAKRGQFAGFGLHPAGINNNLTTTEYRRLAGPPLAPRGAFSRVITNLKTTHGQVSQSLWEAVGAWFEVVDRKGLPFLQYHFNGIGQKVRDLRGIRPAGIARAKQAARNWMISEIRRAG